MWVVCMSVSWSGSWQPVGRGVVCGSGSWRPGREGLRLGLRRGRCNLDVFDQSEGVEFVWLDTSDAGDAGLPHATSRVDLPLQAPSAALIESTLCLLICL